MLHHMQGGLPPSEGNAMNNTPDYNDFMMNRPKNITNGQGVIQEQLDEGDEMGKTHGNQDGFFHEAD
jgi:hypothetical protein